MNPYDKNIQKSTCFFNKTLWEGPGLKGLDHTSLVDNRNQPFERSLISMKFTWRRKHMIVRPS